MRLAVLIGVLLSFSFTHLLAQPGAPAPNRVLELDGNGSYVELPADLLQGIEELTVEAWVKWQEIGAWARVFDCGKGNDSVCIKQAGSSSALTFRIGRPARDAVDITVPNLIQTNEWCHLAATFGRNGAGFYFNGYLIGSDPRGGSLPVPASGITNSLGKSPFTDKHLRIQDTFFAGQMDEVRVWKTARSAEQIRAGMSQRASGQEGGLIGCWNFEDGAARDVSPAKRHGVLKGNARVVETVLPIAQELARPAVLKGWVGDVNGDGTWGAIVRLEQQGAVLAQFNCGPNSRTYELFLFHPESSTYNVVATWAGRVLTRSDIQLQPGQTVELNLTFRDVGSVAGTLRMFDGTPHVAVPVQLLSATNEVVATVLSDASGRFTFTNTPPALYRVRCQVLGGYRYLGVDRKITYGELASPAALREARNVRVNPGQSVEKADFTFAPFKKGTWRTYTTADGLPGGRVWAIYSAPDGALWFGTSGGLARFDGQHFRTFTTKDGLLDDYVQHIARSHDGRLWIATAVGASMYDGQRFRNFGPEDGLARDYYQSIHVVPNGDVWLGPRTHGLYRYDGTRFFNINTNHGFPAGDHWQMDSSADGMLWIAAAAGLIRFDGTNSVSVTAQEGLKITPRSPRVASDGTVWFGSTKQGLWHYSPADAEKGAAAFSNISTQDGLMYHWILSIELA
ncbi:MAG: hypothetical protein HY674_17595, partial [Chloroflexi bacterium]|nr:hypothetical protein [Chloroflexota bacterium]